MPTEGWRLRSNYFRAIAFSPIKALRRVAIGVIVIYLIFTRVVVLIHSCKVATVRKVFESIFPRTFVQ